MSLLLLLLLSLKHMQMCANCGATETRVWRVSNAGLMCCNACGTFWQKHHQHRPEHLLAANEAKRAAQRAASEAAASASDMCGKFCACNEACQQACQPVLCTVSDISKTVC